MTTTAKERYEVLSRLEKAGISYEHANALRRISMTLSRWSELECNGDVQRDETTDIPYAHYGRGTNGPFQTVRIADREKGALKRLRAIVAQYPEFIAYHQTDPRGCAVYLVRKSDVPEGTDIASVYNRGIAVY